ncbi:IS5 family transposase [Neobacillus niacini]|nr:IS5 family transposase [Neobacillus niacini]
MNVSSEEVRKLDDKIKVLEQKKKALEYKITTEDRRARTRRLIQKGALFEKYLENENVSLLETELLLKVLADFKKKNSDYVSRQIQKIMENTEANESKKSN